MRPARCWDLLNSSKKLLIRFSVSCQIMDSCSQRRQRLVLAVFIIRFAERQIDQLLDATILSYVPLASELEAVQFESEWLFLRPFVGKRKAATVSPSGKIVMPTPPSSPHKPLSPTPSQPPASSSASRGFSSLRQTINRARGQSSPVSSVFQAPSPPPSPLDLISFLTSLHTLLVLSDVNPAITTQLWSQVMYWTSCTYNLPVRFYPSNTSNMDNLLGEVFNRVITRKKYICRLVPSSF